MIRDETAPIIIGLVKELVTLVQGVDPEWKRAYLRFSADESSESAKASYVGKSSVEMLNVLRHKPFFVSALAQGRALLNALDKRRGVFVIAVDCKFEYEIKFEYIDMDRWQISKLDGETGEPSGFFEAP